MKQVITKDGSVTFYNSEFDEVYHSKSGAVEEAVEKHAKQADLNRLKEIKVLDVCFGIGYNSAAALDLFTGEKIEIVGLENDPKIIAKISEISPEFKSWNIIKKAASALAYVDDKVKLKIIIGDARKTIKDLGKGFDVVFLDPFSPAKCPELWTFEFISDIAKVCNKGAVLTTYSCARKVRENLTKAGFKVTDGLHVGRYAPSTIAKLI